MKKKGNRPLSVVVRTSAFTLNQGKWVGSLNLGEVVRINYRETRVTWRLVYLHRHCNSKLRKEKKYN